MQIMRTFAPARDKQPLSPIYTMQADYYIIKLERFNQGLTQQELADKAGICLRTLTKAELGQSISPKSNRAIRDALGLK